MTIISTTAGRNPSEEMELPLRSTKESKMQYMNAISKTTEWSLRFQDKPFNITGIEVYAPTSNAEEAEGQHRNQIDYILCSQRWRSSIQWAKTRPGADCGSDHELLIAKFRLKLKKVRKTTRPFRYDLHQIHYDYTVEVRNRFQGLDLIDRVPEELWTELHNIV